MNETIYEPHNPYQTCNNRKKATTFSRWTIREALEPYELDDGRTCRVWPWFENNVGAPCEGGFFSRL